MPAQSPPKLHLDSDSSSVALFEALRKLGHDVTRTPNEWMADDASDERQLLGASAHGRVIFTFNIQDFMPLAHQYPTHVGILLCPQRGWTLAARIAALDRMLTETTMAEWIGQVRWLSQWRG